MSDISKCAGNGCDLREECYRFTAPASQWQSFIVPPAVGEACEYRLPVFRTVAQQPLGDAS